VDGCRGRRRPSTCWSRSIPCSRAASPRAASRMSRALRGPAATGPETMRAGCGV